MASLGGMETHCDDEILKAAKAFVKSQSAQRGLRDEHQLKGRVSRTPIGSTVTYDIYQGNLPIVGMRIEVRMDNAMNVVGSNWNYRPIDLAEVDEGGQPLYDEIANRIPAGFQLRKDGTPFSEVIYELPDQGRGEHSVVVPAVNQFQVPVNLILRATDGAMLSIEMPRYEQERRK